MPDPRYVLQQAVKRGKLRRQPCRDCGEPRTQGHHVDYRKPLDLVWLCSTHHGKEHVRLRREGIEIPGREMLGSSTVAIRLPVSMMARLKELAVEQDRSVAQVIRILLKKSLGKK